MSIPRYVPKDDTPPRDKPPRGRPKPSSSAKTGGKALKPIADIKEGLEQQFAVVAAGLAFKGDYYCATIISSRAPRAIAAWCVYAEQNPSFHRVLALITSGGQASELIYATGMLALPIAFHHIPALQTHPLATKAMEVSQEEMQTMLETKKAMDGMGADMEGFMSKMNEAMEEMRSDGADNSDSQASE